MNYKEISIYTTSQGVEILTGILLDLGIDSFLIEDKEEFKNFLDDNKQIWDIIDDDLFKKKEDETNIKVYIEENEKEFITINNIKEELNKLKAKDFEQDLGSLRLVFNDIKEEDWANNWKKYFKPFEVGKNLAIKPTWKEYDNKEGRIVLEIDPGASFGTGSHETTKLCLMALEEHIKGDETVVDVGCGSGILSIASVKLGARKAIGVDIDPLCIETSNYLAKVNNCEDNIQILIGDLASKVQDSADIIVANIFANIIVRLTGDTKRILKKGGIFISSGIIEESVDKVVSSYKENGYEILSVNKLGNWYSIIGKNN